MGPSPARAPPQEGNREQSTARYQRCPKTSPSSSCGHPAALTPNSLPAFLVGKAGKGPNRWTLEAGGGKAARPSLVGAERVGIGFVFFFPLRLQHKNKALIGIATRRGQLCPVPVGHIPWGAAAASPRPSGGGWPQPRRGPAAGIAYGNRSLPLGESALLVHFGQPLCLRTRCPGTSGSLPRPPPPPQAPGWRSRGPTCAAGRASAAPAVPQEQGATRRPGASTVLGTMQPPRSGRPRAPAAQPQTLSGTGQEEGLHRHQTCTSR